MASFGQLIEELENQLKAANPNFERCGAIVKELKIFFSEIDFTDPNLDKHYLTLSRTFEENVIYYSIRTKNFQEFENAYFRFKTLNDDFEPVIGKSKNSAEVTALYLLYLLSFSKISEFHVALEKLSEEEKRNKFVSFAIKLEDSFMVGNYAEVLQSKSKAPYEYFSVFLDRIIETIRYEIARSVEKAYEYLTVNDLLKFFYFKNAGEFSEFSKTQEQFAKENGVAWKLDGTKLYFQPLDVDKHKYNAMSSATELLQYADELEKIV
jgi:26S proteasome regulatory subunit N12